MNQEKLVKLGWINSQGQELSWKQWWSRHARPKAYLDKARKDVVLGWGE